MEIISDKELAEKILRYRIKNNITQKDFANAIKISSPTINKIEKCKNNTCNTTKMKILMYIEEQEKPLK